MTAADWRDFAEMTGGASGALTGLLFVAVSLHADRIAGHRGLRSSAAQTLALFVAPLVVAAVLLAPDQADPVLGAELIAIGLITSWVLLSTGRAKKTLPDEDQLLVAIFNRRGPNVLVMLFLVVSGILLACDLPDGLYLLLPVTLIAQVSGVLNAWYFLLPPPAATRPPADGAG